MSAMTLDKLVPGESGRIRKIHGWGAIRRRLMDMGLTSGAVIEVIKHSPLGDPIEYRLRGYHLSLRRSEAQTIEVELQEDRQRKEAANFPSGTRMSLNRCKSGQKVEIINTRGGRNMQARLHENGLLPGSVITVIGSDFPGPMILSLNDQDRVVIGKGMARQVLVKTV
jgi:ferrous iron transport protein A